MAIVINFGNHKGGVGKTTSAAITSYLLSKTNKVLAVDFDSQGNLTSFLSQRNIYDFEGKTVLQAVKEKNPRPYIYSVSDTLDILPAEDFLSTLSQFLYKEYKGDPNLLLKETLDVVHNDYDYIIIDCPPNLGEQTINALSAADYAVVLLQSEPFCFDALDRYLEFLESIQNKTNPKLLLAGILTSMLDARTIIDTSILDQARIDYEDIVFNTVIKRRSRIKEFTITGISDHTKQDKTALQQYMEFTEELKQRVQK
ncbi:ParA family protein [Chengkuizengella sediminis]|uniref:ParA family protein n=1 Tax=Chengkuizengella sediminis TaxID=1885917 RepID=UPI001389D66D|nr:ParA family protein [Chengkuizengella sediminis]NDI36612.1 ParA family protein [Chengkuizengella sediminis]